MLAKQDGPQNSVHEGACTPSTAEGSGLRGSNPQIFASVPSTQRRQANDPLIPRPQKTLEQRPGSSAPGPNPTGEGRQAPGRRTEPTGGDATSLPRCALSIGPSALPTLAADGSPVPSSQWLLTQKTKLKTKSRYLMHLVQPSTPMAARGLQSLRWSWSRQSGDTELGSGAGRWPGTLAGPGTGEWRASETRGREGLEA